MASMGVAFAYLSSKGFHFNYTVPAHKIQVYYPTHIRFVPWIIGLALGYYLYQTKDKKIKVNKCINLLLWALSIATLIALVYIPYKEIRYQSENPFLFALYISTHRAIFALALSWMIVSCIKGYGGPVNWFLTFPQFQTLAKLSFAIYMMNAPFEVRLSSLSRGLEYFNMFLMFQYYFGSLVMVILASIPMVLLVEMPVANLESTINKRIENKKTD